MTSYTGEPEQHPEDDLEVEDEAADNPIVITDDGIHLHAHTSITAAAALLNVMRMAQNWASAQVTVVVIGLSVDMGDVNPSQQASKRLYQAVRKVWDDVKDSTGEEATWPLEHYAVVRESLSLIAEVMNGTEGMVWAMLDDAAETYDSGKLAEQVKAFQHMLSCGPDCPGDEDETEG